MTRRGPYERERACPRALVRAWNGLVLVAATLAFTACFPPDEGQEPHLEAIYFPVGLALSPPVDTVAADAGTPKTTRKWLYVVNSDFDLQYNAGTVEVFDLGQIQDQIPKFGAAEPCGASKKPASDADQFLYPGPCTPFLDTASLIGSRAVKIGAFATDILYMPRPDDRRQDSTLDRLVVPVRGDDTLHWIDTDPETGSLDCGADANHVCDDIHRRGDNAAAENTRGPDPNAATLPPEPLGIAADDRGEAVVTTHQSDGSVGLFVNDWRKNAPGQGGPTLQFVLRGLPQAPIGVASIPEPDISRALRNTDSATFYEPGFYVTFRNIARIQLVNYFSDQGDFDSPDTQTNYPGRPFLEATRQVGIETNSQGFDSRGVAVDPSARNDCQRACDTNPGPAECRQDCVDARRTLGSDGMVMAPDKAKCVSSNDQPVLCTNYVNCLRSCAPTPLDVYITNRTPNSLILGRTRPNSNATSSDDAPLFYDTEPVSQGVSRVVIGDVLDSDGNGSTKPVRRVFAICFDSRQIFVYDPVGKRVEAVIKTGRGPHSLAVDETRGLGYVGHFTDSYLGVVDLNRTHGNTYGKMILSIGQPVAPRAQK